MVIPSRERPIRLVFANGSVCDLTEAMSAGDALQSSLQSLADASDMSFNNFLVCDSASLRVGKRACPMHPGTLLEPGHLYYVLPIRTFQHRLAWSHISSLAAMAMAPSSTTTTHLSVYKKSKQCAVSRISDTKFYLLFLFCRRLLFKGKCRVDDAEMASHRRNGALEREDGRAEAGAAAVLSREGTSWRFNNICDRPEVTSKYVEMLIDRSNSWKPPLLTIQES